ncbi:MAG TPA: ArsA family ATPase [Thermoanaerobaculia bacterium]|jgi:arsenite-transporting ATPase|nr:ArsA family ATPase [Thermoanaerobaculia bacterium]
MTLADALDELSTRHVVLFGGKGGVGKTTVSIAAALHFAKSRPTILFTTDPASNLRDLLGDSPTLRIEELDAPALYSRFLAEHIDAFLEIGDRGTYLDREELRRLFELSIPGIDELMAWMHIGELAEENADSLIVVDTAPTGHTLRMLSSSEHFRQIGLALDAMQEKHRAMVRQFTRRDVRDAMDAFIEEFESRAERRRALLTDASRTAFVPVTLPEPLVVEQTVRLIGELGEIDVPFVVLNRAQGEVPAQLAGWRVVLAPRACVPLDTPDHIQVWSAAATAAAFVSHSAAPKHTKAAAAAAALQPRPFMFFAGKGGVGKTTCSASVALQLAARHPEQRYVVISVDPAHSLRDLFESIPPPPNLTVETIDTKAKWRRFRDTFGEKIEQAVDAITPRGMSLSHDTEAMQRLIEIAPPGADELFAITRLSDLSSDSSLAGVIVDTAPTGHFLRLLDLPKEAGEWVREFMRILLRYRELIPAGSLGEELVRASRALKDLETALHSERTQVIVVARPERIVIAETKRLIENVRGREIRVGGVIANYVTPENGDGCDRSMRAHELKSLEELDAPVIIERRGRPPQTREELLALVPIE